MNETLEIAAVVVAWVVVIWRRPGPRAFKYQPLWLTFVSLAIALTAGLPGVDHVLETVTGAEQIGNLVKHVVGVVAMLSLINWVTSLTRLDDTPPRFTSPRYVFAGLAIVAMTLFFFLVPDRDDQGYFLTSHAGNAVATLYQLVFVAYVGAAMLIGCALFGRSARRAPRGGLRRSLYLMAIGCGSGIGYAAVRTAYLTLTELDVETPGGAGGFEIGSEALKSAAIALVCLGLSYPAHAAGARALRQWKAIRRLRPLWDTVTDAVPLVMVVEKGPRSRDLVPLDLTFRLTRRTIEIRDAALTLRRGAPEGLYTRAREAAHAAGMTGSRADAAAEAYWLLMAVRVLRTDGPGEGDDSYVSHPASTPTDELAWLLRVAAAFDSPAMRILESTIGESAI